MSRIVAALVVLAFVFAVACGEDEPQTNPTCQNCPGCCDASGQCLPGNTLNACGTAGGLCQSCSSTQQCLGGTCAAGGCSGCTLNGQCQLGNSDQACGSGGSVCQACTGGQSCVAGTCQSSCSFQNCTGCCDGNTCVNASNEAACGVGGAQCAKCDAGKKCVLGQCTEQSGCANCAGCCENNACLSGDTIQACGTGGGACKQCTADQACVAGNCESKPTCDKSNCNGCCTANGQCVPQSAQSPASCGKEGGACQVCGAGAQCAQGQCIQNQPCFSFCTSGCCTANGQCIAFAQQDAKQCGTAGKVCVACGTGKGCASGVCIADPVWEIHAVSAIVSAKDANGKDWDTFPSTSLPDPYASIRIVGNFLFPSTKSISNTLTPFWNEKVVTEKETDITSKGLDISIRDSDTVGYNTMGDCKVTPTQAQLQGGTLTVTNCGPLVKDLVLTFKKQ